MININRGRDVLELLGKVKRLFHFEMDSAHRLSGLVGFPRTRYFELLNSFVSVQLLIYYSK
jgi:hypothetical protein